ncbi:MAG: NAD(+) synthase [Planctomycetota bacterium]
MQHFAVGAGELNQTPLDWSGNCANIRAVIAAAKSRGVGLLCLPELCITGYGCEDAFQGAWVADTAWQQLLALRSVTANIAVAVGLPLRHRGALYNVVALLADQHLVALVAKQHLAGDGIHYEPRWFKPWPDGGRVVFERDGLAVPLGDLCVDLGGLRVGFEICEDAWVAQRPGARLASRALDVICNPSASHFAFDKIDLRERLVLEGSRAFGVTYVYANLLGNEAGRAIYDGGAMIATAGKLVARGARFSYRDWRLVTAVVDVGTTRTQQVRSTNFTPSVSDDATGVVRVRWTPPGAAAQVTSDVCPAWEAAAERKHEEFTRAQALALFDYCRKSRSQGFVVSLSGGADSTAVSCLVRLSVDLGWRELGGEEFCRKLGVARADDATAVMTEFLTCVYQRTQYSSTTTEHAARDVAAAIGATFHVFDVEPLVAGYLACVEKACGRILRWDRDDIALQNIQARVRGPSVWLLANLRNALLLATSNRSEAAVGYATMDGDTCGGLAPIAGIDKAYLLTWLKWLEHTGPNELRPMPALAAVTRLSPTAELRPREAEQLDETDLMPYAVLDIVERAAIRDKRSPEECWTELKARCPNFADEQLRDWVVRFFQLWSRNQWKRERYAPSFHLDDESLDPKTWCRFPILSGGFSFELKRLAGSGLDAAPASANSPKPHAERKQGGSTGS